MKHIGIRLSQGNVKNSFYEYVPERVLISGALTKVLKFHHFRILIFRGHIHKTLYDYAERNSYIAGACLQNRTKIKKIQPFQYRRYRVFSG